jgi:hypothetical protein
MKTKTIFKKTLTAVAFAVAAAVSTSASAALVFQIDESSVADALPRLKTLDRVQGQYSEQITFAPPTNGFTAAGFFDASGYFLGSTVVSSQLNLGPDFAPRGYALYATFRSDGTFAPNASGGTTFTGNTGGTNELKIFLDPNEDTVKSLDPTNATTVTRTGQADDLLLASSTTLSSGVGRQDATSNAAGNFELIFNDFTLASAGNLFFVSPRPFYTRIDLQGGFDNFDVGGPLVVTTGGSANATFIVPEPTTLALLGASLLGLGFSTRRKKLS